MNRPLKPRPTASNVFSSMDEYQERLQLRKQWAEYDKWQQQQIKKGVSPKWNNFLAFGDDTDYTSYNILTDNWSEAHGYWHANV